MDSAALSITKLFYLWLFVFLLPVIHAKREYFCCLFEGLLVEIFKINVAHAELVFREKFKAPLAFCSQGLWSHEITHSNLEYSRVWIW